MISDIFIEIPEIFFYNACQYAQKVSKHGPNFDQTSTVRVELWLKLRPTFETECGRRLVEVWVKVWSKFGRSLVNVYAQTTQFGRCGVEVWVKVSR